MNKTHNDEYSSDSPINSELEDKFQRFNFSKRIADTISNRKDTNCLTIGIYGAWGEGKTSVLNFIEKELKKSNNVIAFKFNPWRYSDENALLVQFFNQFAFELGSSIKKPKEKLGGVFQEYGKYLNIDLLGFNVGETAKNIGDKLATVSVETLKGRIEEIIRDSDKKIVIFIDDIDRLDRTEIHSVFRLVKLTADFYNTTYVLSFDEEMVSAAIGERFGNGDKISGRNFLEKIIQVPLQIPLAQQKDLMDFCFTLINKTIDGHKIELSKEDNDRFVSNFLNNILIKLDTPRLAVRYSNSLSFSIPLMVGEVNITDLMLVEALKIFYPSHYEFLKSNSEYFINGYERPTYERGSDTVEERMKFLKENLERLGNHLTAKQKAAIKELLISMFPQMQGAFRSVGFSDETYRNWILDKRIASGRYFSKYFSYSTERGNLPDLVFNEFIDKAKSSEASQIASLIRQLVSQSSAEDFLFKLRILEEQLMTETSIKIAKAICLISDVFPHPTARWVFSFTTPRGQAVFYVVGILKLINSDNERFKYMKDFILSAREIEFASELRFRCKSAKETQIFNEKQISEFEEIILRRALKESSDSNLLVKFPSLTSYLLNHWAKSNKKEMRKYLDNLLNESSKFSIIILRCFSNVITSTSHPEPYVTDFSEDSFKYLNSSVESKYLSGFIDKCYSKKEVQKESVLWMNHDTGQTDINLVRQFKHWVNSSNSGVIVKKSKRGSKL